MRNILIAFLILFTCFTYSQSGTLGAELITNGTFDSSTGWTLRNSSTISSGVATIITGTSGDGGVGNSTANWSLSQGEDTDIEFVQKWEDTNYFLTFDAKQTAGSGVLEVGQRNSDLFKQVITSDWVTYEVEFIGNNSGGGPVITFGGAAGNTFQIDNVSLKGMDFQTITYLTDFETDTYAYEQFGAVGANVNGNKNQWEVDQGTARTTDHVDAEISTGRDGTGRALWLGDYNSPSGLPANAGGEYGRNEVGRDLLMNFTPHWIGFSFFIAEPVPDTRIFMQNRVKTGSISKNINALSLRHGSSAGEMYFSLADDPQFVDATEAGLEANPLTQVNTGTTYSTWGGAGTGTTPVTASYNVGQWNDIVIHYKGAFGASYTGASTAGLTANLGFDPRSDGLIEIWVNGTKVVDQTGTTVYRYASTGQEVSGEITPKIGTYWNNSNTPQGSIYYDDYTVCTGPDCDYAAVDPAPPGGNQPPNAIASANPQSGTVSLQVAFTGDTSTDDVGISTYAWDFGDGVGTSSSANPTYTYTSVGNYTAVLTVTDGGSLQDTANVPIIVNAEGPGGDPPGTPLASGDGYFYKLFYDN